MMNIKPLALALILGIGSTSLIAATPAPLQAGNVMDAISTTGLVGTYDLEYRYGVWTAESTTPSGERVDVLFDPATGQVTTLNKTSLGTTALDAADIRALLSSRGYTSLDDIEFDDGLWNAKARNTLRQRVYLVIHPVTGEILDERVHGTPSTSTPQSALSAAQIIQSAESAGYRNLHDLDFDDGVWEADAINAQGQRVEIKIDPFTGSILREKLDD